MKVASAIWQTREKQRKASLLKTIFQIREIEIIRKEFQQDLIETLL
jgi:hypothetical protein